MFRKIGSFFEQHIEKIVLGVVGIVCIWLLITRVLISPNAVRYNNDRISPSEIDKRILEQANELERKLSQPSQPKQEYVSRLTGVLDPNDPIREGIMGKLQDGFAGLMDVAIPDINTSLFIPLPRNISGGIAGGREYALPLTNQVIGEVNSVAVEYIRAAAYMPTIPVTEDVPYENSVPEPNDMDLVTVEAKFDVAQLYKKFHECFASDFVPIQWRDPCLAVPVFAAVQLQRQELLDDGSFSPWQDVPRSKIDRHKRLFEIVEHVENLPLGGIKVRLLQFNMPEVTMELLQPPPYQIASANQEWFPPSLHNKFVQLQKKEKLEQRREEIKAQKEETGRSDDLRIDRGRGDTLGTRSSTGRGSPYEGSGIMDRRATRDEGRGTRRSRDSGRAGRADSGLYGNTGPYSDRGGLSGDRQRRSRTRVPSGSMGETDYLSTTQGEPVRAQPSSEDVYNEYQGILITEITDLSKMREPLIFWAHDDTVEPGKTYQYRIRLGVFNPLAGTNQIKQQDKSMGNAVILWSKFSKITQPVSIRDRMYLFAKEMQEAAKMVKVQVSKYVLGYWYSEDFMVRQGEAIGKVVELDTATSSSSVAGRPSPGSRITRQTLPGESFRGVSPRGGTYDPRIMGYQTRVGPESVDFSTGVVLVDAIEVNDWLVTGQQLRPRVYFDMLYSLDGTSIERMAISANNWPAETLTIYNEINSSQREPKEPLRSWESRVGPARRQQLPTLEGEGVYPYQDYMMDETMGGIRPY